MKSRINLFNVDFLPVEALVSIQNIFKVGVGITVIFLSSIFYYLTKVNSLQIDVDSLLEAKVRLETEKQLLDEKLSKRQPNNELISQVNLAKERLHLRQVLLRELVHKSTVNSNGFSRLFTELARVSVENFWLEHIYVCDDSLNFSGFSLKPQTVPYWVNQLKEKKIFDGYTFSSMMMVKNEGDPISFSLISRPKEPTLMTDADKGNSQ